MNTTGQSQIVSKLLISKSGLFASQSLCFYKKKDDAFCKIELYQPCGTGTLNEPLSVTSEKWLAELDGGERTAPYIGSLRMIERGGMLVSDGKFPPKREAKREL